MNTCELHLSDGQIWRFTYSALARAYVCKQRKYTYHVICERSGTGKQVWVGRVYGGGLSTCERELKAVKVVFRNGGEYHFPSRA